MAWYGELKIYSSRSVCQSQDVHRANSCGVRTPWLCLLGCTHRSLPCGLLLLVNLFTGPNQRQQKETNRCSVVSFRCGEGHLTTTSTAFLLRSFLHVLSIVKLLWLLAAQCACMHACVRVCVWGVCGVLWYLCFIVSLFTCPFFFIILVGGKWYCLLVHAVYTIQ